MNSTDTTPVPLWDRFEQTFISARPYTSPLQDAVLGVTFTAPSGRTRTVDGFWDGGTTWHVRFAPDEPGEWAYITSCSDSANAGLHNQAGGFTCAASGGATRFDRHGPIRVADGRRYL